MGNTVGNAVSSKQEETTGSMKRLSHLSCFMWLMGTIHSSIHPFFPSVNKDVWVPSICQTLVQVLKMSNEQNRWDPCPMELAVSQWKCLSRRSLPLFVKPQPVPLQPWGWLLHRVAQALRKLCGHPSPRGQGLQLLAAWSVPPCTLLPPFF